LIYNQVYSSFHALCNISTLNSLLYLHFSVHLRDKALIVLFLSFSCLTFRVVAFTFLLSKEITFKSLPYFLDTLIAVIIIFILFSVLIFDLLNVFIATFLQLLTS
jgi:hypothetical protein